MSKFQVITIIVFIVAIIGGVASFALYRGSGGDDALPPITIWGTFPASSFGQHMANVNSARADQVTVNYVEKSPDSFSREFTNALALGQGPDAILISADALLPETNKLRTIPFDALSEREFKDAYVKEAFMYISPSGIMAIPFAIDPLVMYWNRSIFTSSGLAVYPKHWDEFSGTSLKPGLTQKITEKDQNGNIRRSALAMGDFTNIRNGRELLGSLLMQTGNPVTRRSSDGFFVSTLASDDGGSASAVEFFSQFANPSSPNYSWNRAMPADKTSFLAGVLATYFGFASELMDIRSKNPNLDFDVAPLPQSRNGAQASYGRMYGFSLVRASPQPNVAYQVVSILVSPQYLSQLSKSTYLPPVRNDLIAAGSKDPYITMFNQAALTASGWLDVDPAASRQILGMLVQGIVSGQKTVRQALADAAEEHSAALRRMMQ